MGTGASERRPFPRQNTEAAEAYFVESLEAWRIDMGLERMAVIGHSLGGYIASAYACKYPTRVALLGLCSPAGMPEPIKPTPQSLASKEPTLSDTWVYYLVRKLWELDYTPHGTIRVLGSWGKHWVRAGFHRRISRFVLAKPFTAQQTEDLSEYLYHCLALPASGEFALNAFLHLPSDTHHLTVETLPVGSDSQRALGQGSGQQHIKAGHFAQARKPVAPRLLSLAQRLSCSGSKGFPVSVTYGGSHDWMVTNAGPDLASALSSHTQFTGTEFVHSTCHFLPRSGHHCYLEAPEEFNRVYLSALAGVAARAGLIAPALARALHRNVSSNTVDADALTPREAALMQGEAVVRPGELASEMVPTG